MDTRLVNADSVEVRFAVTPHELYRAQRAMVNQTWWARGAGVWAGLLPSVLIVGVGLYAGATFGEAVRSNWPLVVGFPLFWLVGMPLVQRRAAERAHRAAPALQGEQAYRFDAGGVAIRTPVSEAALRWDAVVRVVETREFLLLFQSKAAATFVPTRAFGGEAELARCRAIVSAAVGGRARWRTGGGSRLGLVA